MTALDVAKRKLIFVHVAKTAGTSLASVLSKHFINNRIATPFYGDYSIYSNSEWDFAAGHFNLIKMRRLYPDAIFITLLRHPVDRMISQYRSLKNRNNLTQEWQDSLTADQLAGVRFCQDNSLSSCINCDDPEVKRYFDEPYIRQMSASYEEATLPAALSNLQSLDFIGIVEDWHVSLERLGQLLGLSLNSEVNLNVSEPFEADLSSCSRETVEKRIGRDIAIYRTAKQNFLGNKQGELQN